VRTVPSVLGTPGHLAAVAQRVRWIWVGTVLGVAAIGIALPGAAAAAGLVITAAADGATVTTAHPVFSGSGNPGDTLLVQRTVGSTQVTLLSLTIGASGSFSGELALVPGVQTIDYTDLSGGTLIGDVMRTITYAAPVITAPADGDTVTTAHPVFSGSGTPGDMLLVQRTVGSTQVTLVSLTIGANGNFSGELALVPGVQTIDYSDQSGGTLIGEVTRTIVFDDGSGVLPSGNGCTNCPPAGLLNWTASCWSAPECQAWPATHSCAVEPAQTGRKSLAQIRARGRTCASTRSVACQQPTPGGHGQVLGVTDRPRKAVIAQ
jgi:hypothetical protein